MKWAPKTIETGYNKRTHFGREIGIQKCSMWHLLVKEFAKIERGAR